MERAVIEIFDLLRPEAEPLFLISQNSSGRDYPVEAELARHGFRIARFSDIGDWPRIETPRSLGHLTEMARILRLGNQDVMRHTADCDAIYLPGVMYGYYAAAAMLRCRARGKRVLHQFHEFGLRPSRQIDWLNHFVTDHVHITQYGFDTVAELNPSILKRRNHVIPPIVELPDCAPAPEMLEAFEGHRNIVYAGQISAIKGIDILVEAFQLLASRYPDLRLHLLGAPAGESTERIRYWGFRNDVPAFFRAAYVVVQSTPPSRYRESFGRTAAEGALAGAPVVCFASGALPGIVSDGLTGTVCQEESAAAMATAIARYLDDPAMRDRHAANATQHENALFSREKVREAWLNCLGV